MPDPKFGRLKEKKAYFNKGYDRCFTRVYKDASIKHEVEHNLDLIRFLGGKIQSDFMELWSGEEDRRTADNILRGRYDARTEWLMAICPSALEPKKQWPFSNFVQLCRELIQKHKYCKILMVGGGEDRQKGKDLEKELGAVVVNAAGEANLRVTLELLKKCAIYVGNDTGAAHLAAAAGIPVVVISGHAACGSLSSNYSPTRFGPQSSKSIIVQPQLPLAPCSDECHLPRAHCITQIQIAEVKKAVSELIPDGCK